jgi:hypothetical protein
MMLIGFAGLGFAFRQSRRKVSFIEPQSSLVDGYRAAFVPPLSFGRSPIRLFIGPRRFESFNAR